MVTTWAERQLDSPHSSPRRGAGTGDVCGYREIAKLVEVNRLPAVYRFREHVEADGLLSYGPNSREMPHQDRQAEGLATIQ